MIKQESPKFKNCIFSFGTTLFCCFPCVYRRHRSIYVLYNLLLITFLLFTFETFYTVFPFESQIKFLNSDNIYQFFWKIKLKKLLKIHQWNATKSVGKKNVIDTQQTNFAPNHS